MSATDAQAAAAWMLQKVNEPPLHELYQSDAVEYIAKNFDDGLTYTNDNGNPAIDKAVLKAFKEISGDAVVWERGWRGWRLRNSHDPVGKRQAD